jgi:hypothetical protein
MYYTEEYSMGWLILNSARGTFWSEGPYETMEEGKARCDELNNLLPLEGI